MAASQKKIASELAIKAGEFKAKVGTMDRKHPQTVYIECGTFIEPIFSNISYKDEFKYIERKIKKSVQNIIVSNPNYVNDFIFVLDVPVERIKVGRKNYLSVQIFLRFTNSDIIKEETFNDIVKKETGFYLSIISGIKEVLMEYDISCKLRKS